ncbi:MAG TPA: N-acetylmuramoyl-L-alanine amidase [Blastocatellia bacterium]|nr:N-acetylmuramoyl-L-alanine amidase [Blastocatellia bacterium]
MQESATAKYPKPVIMTRTGWGCPDGQGNPRGTPSYTTVTHLIVHHTANSNTSSDWAAVVRSIWNFHIFTNGWSDIGYNYLIDPNGVIYEGRSGGDNVVGAHFSCQNGATMGVALLGTFTSIQPTNAARDSMKELLSWKADQREIDPTGSSVHSGMQQALANISGHRDGNGLARSCTVTECPGELFYPTLASLRSEVKSLVSPMNDFQLTAATSNQVIAKGGVVTFSITSATTNGAAQTINLSLRETLSGITTRFSSNSIVTGNGTQLTVTVPETTPSGIYPLTIIGTGTTKRSLGFSLTVTGTIASVSAASYQPATSVASESLISAFGVNLTTETQSARDLPLPTTLADVTVKIKDSRGTEAAAPLFYVSPTQINYQIPPQLALGTATVTVTHKSAITAVGTLDLTTVAPGLFTANANGVGAAAGVLQRRKADGSDVYEPLAQYDEGQKLFVPRQLDLRSANEQYFLTLFGTGIRFRNPALPVTSQIGGVEVEVLYAGEQKEYVGLDQVNLRLTPELIGKGQLDVILKVEGKSTNPISVAFR